MVPVFVVIGLLIVALCALCIWCIFLRRRKGEYPIDSNNSNSYGPSNRTPPTATPQRRSSRLSQLGFLGRSRSFSVERNLPQIQTNGLSASEKRPGNDSTTPTDRRSSFPMRFVDQRLDPVAVWNPLHSNGSHVSVSSFRDDRDYSRRMLRVSHPLLIHLLRSALININRLPILMTNESSETYIVLLNLLLLPRSTWIIGFP